MQPRHTKLPSWLALAIFIAGLGLFLARVPSGIRGFDINMDSGLVTVAARAWAHGQSPYDLKAFSAAWVEMGGPAGGLDSAWRGPQAFVYPPATYVLGAPLGMLPFELARALWNGINLALFALSMVLALRLARIPLRSSWGAAGCGLMLGMAAVHTDLRLGQTAVMVLAPVLGAVTLRLKGRPWLAGLCLGLACCIKPQVGLIFVGYELGRGRWKIAAGAFLCVAVLMGAGLGRMWAAGIHGLGGWTDNLHALLETDANPIAPDIWPHRLIDLASPISVVLDDIKPARVIAMVIMAVFAAAYVGADWARGRTKTERGAELLTLSAVTVVMLLVAYHRLYDAVFLVIPLMLGLAQLRAGERAGWITLLFLAPFYAPGASILVKLQVHGVIPAHLAESKLWMVLVMQHQTWALLGLMIWLIALRWAGGASPELNEEPPEGGNPLTAP
jgi:hypothetical protein